MGTRETVRTMTINQYGELLASVIQQFPTDLTFDQAQFLIGRKRWIGSEIARILHGSENSAEILADWQNFYREYGIKADFSRIIIPAHKSGFDRVLMVPKGLTINHIWMICRDKFNNKVWSYYGDDLDSCVPVNDRTTDQPYAIRIRDREEADEELKGLSANQLKERQIPCVTLLERLIYELKYFDETGKHPDIKNITLCSGSRYSDGRVPDVYWDSSDGLRVGWYGSDRRSDGMRARAAVSA